MTATGRKKAKADTIARLNALWVPTAPRIILIGSRITAEEADEFSISTSNLSTDSSGAFLVSGDDHAQAILKTWVKVFGTASELPSPDIISRCMSSYDTSKWDWNLAAQFDPLLVSHYLQKLKHTGSGKDGVHSFCFKLGGQYVVQYLVRLIDGFFNCKQLPEDINDGLLVFLSKADKDDDKDLSSEGVYRSPLDLRPLTLKNSENKVVAGVINWIIKLVVERAACSIQNGFVGGRQLIQNPVDLDFRARQDSLLFQQAMDDGNMCFNINFFEVLLFVNSAWGPFEFPSPHCAI